jgi:hypothetical protein
MECRLIRLISLCLLAEKQGIHDAREDSGHEDDRDSWRGVTLDQQTLAEAIDALESRTV